MRDGAGKQITSGTSIGRVAVVGTGRIGASWATQFLAAGLDVIATDPAPNAERALHAYVAHVWPVLARLGLKVGASPARLSFTSNVLHAVADADFVQESSPERPDFKIQLFKEMDAAAKKDTILASSSSGLTMSMIQSKCARPDRCVIAHPCNPPHLIPLVEVVGGTQTSKQTIQRTVAFFREIGKRPITLKREVQGHVANRLRAALQRELISLLSAGVVDLADADTAVSWGPGLRWGVMGPNMLLHLAGGAGGIAHALDHVAGPMEMLWKDLGTQTELAEDTRALMLKGISAASGGKTTDELAYQRDHVLVRLILARRSFESQET